MQIPRSFCGKLPDSALACGQIFVSFAIYEYFLHIYSQFRRNCTSKVHASPYPSPTKSRDDDFDLKIVVPLIGTPRALYRHTFNNHFFVVSIGDFIMICLCNMQMPVLIFANDRGTDSYFTVIKAIGCIQVVESVAGAVRILVGAQEQWRSQSSGDGVKLAMEGSPG